MWLRTTRLPVTVTASERATAAEIAAYLAQIAARLDERPEPMRIVFTVPPGTQLDLRKDGRFVVRVPGSRPKTLDLRRRWIADHPVPLALHHAVLYADPVDANRFRVFSRGPWRRALRRLCRTFVLVCFAIATLAIIYFFSR